MESVKEYNQVLQKYLIPIREKLQKQLDAFNQKMCDDPLENYFMYSDQVSGMLHTIQTLMNNNVSINEIKKYEKGLDYAIKKRNEWHEIRKLQMKNMDKFNKQRQKILFELRVIKLFLDLHSE